MLQKATQILDSDECDIVNPAERRKAYVSEDECDSWNYVQSAVVLKRGGPPPPQLAIDNPTEGQHVSGLFNILGWAVGITAPIDSVEVSFDGHSPTPAGYGGKRTDVGHAFPDIPDADFSGYALGLNARLPDKRRPPDDGQSGGYERGSREPQCPLPGVQHAGR